MNKVDVMVREALLAYPNLYRSRFEVLNEFLFNSCYEWDQNGCLVPIFPLSRPATPEAMIAEYEGKLAKAEQEAIGCHECLQRLNEERVVEAKAQLHRAKFVAENIDIYARSYIEVDYHDYWLWLFRANQDSVSSKYGCINSVPDVIDEEWRDAIYHWFKELLSPMHSLMGMYDETGPQKGWKPRQGCEEVFTWVYQKFTAFESPKQKSVRRRMAADISRIIAEAELEETDTDK